MKSTSKKRRAFAVAVLVVLITSLHYATGQGRLYYHLFYRDLYYLPLIMAGLWFGLRGALFTSFSITVLFLPFMVVTWQHVPLLDFDRVLEILLLNAVAVVLGVIRDRERASQEEVAASRNLAAIGKAVAGVAHDIKTPLTAIGGFTRLVYGRLPETDPNREKLEIAIREADRLETLVREMLDSSRPLQLNVSRVDAKDIVNSLLLLVDREVTARGVRIETKFESRPAFLDCDENRLREALLNLLINAIQATPRGGKVGIAVRRDGASMFVDVIDEGPGISEGIRENIFVPFFTTKNDGTGLGLAIVSKIIQAHNGTVDLIENAGNGMTFRVVLPTKSANE
jgi:two-component system sensor histidine kinase HydH